MNIYILLITTNRTLMKLFYKLHIFVIMCQLPAFSHVHRLALLHNHRYTDPHRLDAVRLDTPVWKPAVIAFLVLLSKSLLHCPPQPVTLCIPFIHPLPYSLTQLLSFTSLSVLVCCLLTSPTSKWCKCHSRTAPSTRFALSAEKKFLCTDFQLPLLPLTIQKTMRSKCDIVKKGEKNDWIPSGCIDVRYCHSTLNF